MSVLAFGDLHVNKEQIRVVTVLNFLDYIIDYCKKNTDIKSVINLGDTFDLPQQKTDVLIPVYKKMKELSEIVNLYTILGNHDLITKDGSNTLSETFSSFGTFIQNVQTIDVPGLGEADFLSYTDDINSIPNKSRILFGHLEVEGFYFNPKRKIDDSIFTSSLFDQYDLVVSGHLHHEQHKNNFEFVGTPYPTRRDEAGKKNYFAIIDENHNVRLEEYNDGPDYITIRAEEFNENIDYNNKIVDVIFTSKSENIVKLRDIIFNKGAIELNPIFEKTETIQDESSHNIDKNEGVVKSAAKFLQEVKADGIDNNKLLNCFKNVLSRCK